MVDKDTIIRGCENWIKNHKGEDLILGPTAVEELLALLKEQEAVKPYMDYDGHDVWRCGKCGATIFHIFQNESDEDWKSYAKFCRHCGLKVKWE